MLAPTGTIGFMMDCDTTGIEPDIALVKYKRLVGGGMLKITNQTVSEALARPAGLHTAAQKQIIDHISSQDTIEGASGLRPEHLAVFDCAFRAQNGTRSIHPMGHIKMMAAARPFISGRNQQDGQPAERCVRRRHRKRLHAGLAAWAQRRCDLPRRLQAQSAAVHLEDRSQRPPGPQPGRPERAADAGAHRPSPPAVRQQLPERAVRRDFLQQVAALSNPKARRWPFAQAVR